MAETQKCQNVIKRKNFSEDGCPIAVKINKLYDISVNSSARKRVIYDDDKFPKTAKLRKLDSPSYLQLMLRKSLKRSDRAKALSAEVKNVVNQ